MTQQTYVLIDEHRRRNALAAVYKAPLGVEVQLGEPTRTLEQNKRLHAMLTDIADQIGWPPDTGEIRTLEWWKRRTTLQWLIDEKRQVEIITPLEEVDGEPSVFALLLPHTSHLKIRPFAAYLQWVESFGIKNGVVFREPEERP